MSKKPSLCPSLCFSGGLGDGWGHPTRFSPLDNMTKELGSHLLQVSTPALYLALCLQDNGALNENKCTGTATWNILLLLNIFGLFVCCQVWVLTTYLYRLMQRDRKSSAENEEVLSFTTTQQRLAWGWFGSADAPKYPDLDLWIDHTLQYDLDSGLLN